MITPKEFGKIFTEARESRDLSVDRAAAESHIHSNVVRDIENGVFDRLGKVYVKSFIKKYAQFLELDTDSVLQQYESVSTKVPGREFNLDEEKDQKDETIKALSDNKVQIILAGVLSLVLVILIFVFVGMMRSRMSSDKPSLSGTSTEKSVDATVETQPVVIAKKPAPSFFSFNKTSPNVTLTLRAEGESWLQVSTDDQVLFTGILKSGDSKSWTADGPITVWTGKADNLRFVVNETKVGVIASGVVKNIKVSSEGVRIGDAWVARLK